MKISSSSSSKPISSPGRTEKFPPPLVRFLRTNAGSRSRGRPRASPLLTRKKTASGAEAASAETQEPSSPKVTCIGQVRVRRPGKSRRKRKTSPENRCCCVRKVNFRKFVNLKLIPRLIRSVWRKWVFFFHCGRVKIRSDSSKNVTNRVEETSGEDEDGDEPEERERSSAFFSPSATPPKNALLLTRCRSAPYRSSSLTDRFWESPLKIGEAPEAEQESSGNRKSTGSNAATPPLENEPFRRDSVPESRTDQESVGKNLGICEAIECSNREIPVLNSPNSHVIRTDETDGFKGARNLMLKRSNSEPSRRSLKFDPEIAIVCRQKRLGIALSSTPHSVD
ncbi:hypothetical protein Nepgr_028244 [Nepenthes gracilis]|uniref:Uncharacterized protein n=1 Tax=Nepenthes gracilis TaxID=150966 RepID=A0AAD3Y4C1_NEPGR|nr:hypothetical protein Nepgr_028244 [Nepenthes gracilis]